MFALAAISVDVAVRAVQGAGGGVHPVLGEDVQDGLPRDVRFQEGARDEGHHRGRERRGRRQT